jgi:hypothetical protein
VEIGVETRRRLERLIAKQDEQWRNPSTQRVRIPRAVEVLERAGTPEAQQVLEVLAKGALGARLTEAARIALDRLKQRGG